LEHQDIGFAFLPKYSNKGYAFEGSKSVMNYLKNQNLGTHILASVFPENVSINKIIQNLNDFNFECEVLF
jgi:[ribosomal protein S5]-alanine N-acetyltransferase